MVTGGSRRERRKLMGSIKTQKRLHAVVAAVGCLAMVSLAAVGVARGQEPRGEGAIGDARPPAGARRAWQYKQTWPCRTHEAPGGDGPVMELNELGRQGWELVSFAPLVFSRDCFVATFKREVPR
jgi:hypothetical protein